MISFVKGKMGRKSGTLPCFRGDGVRKVIINVPIEGHYTYSVPSLLMRGMMLAQSPPQSTSKHLSRRWPKRQRWGSLYRKYNNIPKTALTDANNNVTRYDYDSLGRLTQETDPLSKVSSYSYDSKGNLTAKTDAKGQTISYSYDATNRLLSKSYPDGSEETFSYDSKGNLLTAANKNISYSFSYARVQGHDTQFNIAYSVDITLTYENHVPSVINSSRHQAILPPLA